MLVDEKGYVIRCYDLDTNKVKYRGNHGIVRYNKDALMPNDTYTISGAKRALANLQNMTSKKAPISFSYSIERLSCYFFPFPEKEGVPNQRIYDQIFNARTRLDELWDGNDFDSGDKMRINEVRYALRYIKDALLEREMRQATNKR